MVVNLNNYKIVRHPFKLHLIVIVECLPLNSTDILQVYIAEYLLVLFQCKVF
jgi:hypothetical protein